MPFVTKASYDKTRILLSGLPQSGKTTSLQTFIYGPFDYWKSEQHEQAVQYAGDKHLVILVCPGEFGIKSLPKSTEHISTVYYEASEDEDINSASWSAQALADFAKITTETIKQKPDILCIDGIHALWSQGMNRLTSGDYLQGEDLTVNPTTGKVDPYRQARLHRQSHNMFGQYLAGLYNSVIPLVVATVWEKYEESADNTPGKQQDIGTRRYLWPDIPGEMSKGIVGRFDARLSCVMKARCIHNNCQDSKESNDHYVWQFLPRDDVAGVAIKGLKVHKEMQQRPYIHQNWHSLKSFMERYA